MATRLFYAWDTPAASSPSPHSSWGRTTDMIRRKLTDTKGSTTLTDGSLISIPAFSTTLERQYVSTRMASGITFDTNTTISFPLQVKKDAAGTSVNNFAVAVRIMSDDGSTQRLSTNVATGPNTYQTTMTETDVYGGGSGIFGSAYTTVAGDRIVVEMGHYDGSGSSAGSASSRWGENGTDLTLGSGSTSSSVNPWIEFNIAITFLGEVSNPIVPPIFENPRAIVPPIANRTWLGLPQLVPPSGTPVIPIDYPNPRGIIPPIANRTWLVSPQIQPPAGAPFTPQIWVNPPLVRIPTANLSFIEYYVEDTSVPFLGTTIDSNPRLRQPGGQHWLYSPLGTVLLSPVPTPTFGLTSPNPALRPLPAQTWAYNPIGVALPLPPPNPFFGLTDPVPTRRLTRTADSWVINLMQSTLSPAPPPVTAPVTFTLTVVEQQTWTVSVQQNFSVQSTIQ